MVGEQERRTGETVFAPCKGAIPKPGVAQRTPGCETEENPAP